MRVLLLLLLIAFVAAFGFSEASLDRRVEVRATVERPLVAAPGRTVALPLSESLALDLAGSESLRLALRGYGSDHVGVLVVRAAGGPVELTSGTDIRGERLLCVPPNGGTRSCRLVVRLIGTEVSVFRLVPQAGRVTIETVAFEPVTAKRHAAATGIDILAGFSLLLLFGPVLVWLRRWPGAEQLALIAGGLAWIAYSGLTVMLVSLAFVLAGYLVVRGIARVKDRRSRAIAAAISGIALLLVLIKFAGPVMAAAFANPGGFWLALPLGISYFAIRIVDLVLAASAGALRGFNLRDYLAFLLSPYTLPAGPIQLYGEFLRARIESYSSVDFAAGTARFVVGLGKKLVADSFLLPAVTRHMGVFLSGEGDVGFSVLMMLVANVLYVYLDFSAYCDLAIGAARAGGRRLPENFDWPLVRDSLRGYWRHWHMTLSQWVMRRVYFPAFLASHSTTLALVASMLVIGLWHAPTIPWALWALHHSLAMAAESRLRPDAQSGQAAGAVLRPWYVRAPMRAIGTVATFSWVALGHSFTLFAAPRTALDCYVTALAAPALLIWRTIG